MSLPIPLKRDLFLSEQVDQESMRKISEEIIKINKDDEFIKRQYQVYDLEYIPKPIKIYIDSYGGSIYQCLGLIGIMERSKTSIWTYATGSAMSCGFLILISGHKRFGYKYSTPLYHQVSNWIDGKMEDLKDRLNETKRLQKLIDEITISKTKLSKKKLKEINSIKKDWFLTAEESLEYGVIDEIV